LVQLHFARRQSIRQNIRANFASGQQYAEYRISFWLNQNFFDATDARSSLSTTDNIFRDLDLVSIGKSQASTALNLVSLSQKSGDTKLSSFRVEPGTRRYSHYWHVLT
jgi:hypothetical protein